MKSLLEWHDVVFYAPLLMGVCLVLGSALGLVQSDFGFDLDAEADADADIDADADLDGDVDGDLDGHHVESHGSAGALEALPAGKVPLVLTLMTASLVFGSLGLSFRYLLEGTLGTSVAAIAEITQLNLTERNRLVREGEQARKHQDVQTRQAVLELDRAEKAAEALQQAEVSKVEAEATRDAHVKRIEAQQRIDLANVEKEKSLEVAARQQQEAVEVAERAKQEKVALAEKQRAAAERELADAEAERETARQRVETVRVTEEAAREKRRQVIEAEAVAEMGYVTAQRDADASAYATQRQAEARQLSASADADAIRKKAEAEAEAERLRAAGRKAVEMVPVEVERARVLVDRDRLETVVKPELEAREMHGKVAQDFEVKKLEIEAQKEIRIASARASASLFTKMEAKLFGTPEDVNKLLSSVLGGQSMATAANAFLAAADPNTTRVVDGFAKGLGGLAEAASKKLMDAGTKSPSNATTQPSAGNGVVSNRDDAMALDDQEIEVLDSADDAPEAPAA